MESIQIRPFDFTVVILYLLGMALFGAYLAKKNKTTEAYFVGNRSFSGWVIGLSILGTIISSMTFLTIPAAAYTLDWRQLTSNLTLPLIAIVAIIFFIPVFRRSRLTTSYEYLDLRFSAVARWYCVVSGILFQFFRVSAILFLVSIPVSMATGVDITIIIICMGVFIAFYTVLGGIEAVIWTDVVQAIILLLGGVFAFLVIVNRLPEGFAQIIEMGSADNKFSLGEMQVDFGERTFWTVFLLGVFSWIGMYSNDQTIIQRYVAAKSTKAARMATTFFSATVVPVWAFFYLIGTSLYVFYKVNHDPAIAELHADQIFPYFILTELPVGITGIIIAGLLAAAMSSLDSSINAVSTVLTVDIAKPYLLKGRTDKFYLNMARIIGIATAIIMILGAIYFSRVPKESMNDINWIMSSLLSGGMIGIYIAGIFTTRIDSKALMVALVAAFLVNLYLGLGMRDIVDNFGIHDYWIGPLVNAVFLTFAFAWSFITGVRPDKENLRNLTVWTMDKNYKE
ncbi:MAG: sodium:solute symporter [Puniceicoccaceae bacterium]